VSRATHSIVGAQYGGGEHAHLGIVECGDCETDPAEDRDLEDADPGESVVERCAGEPGDGPGGQQDADDLSGPEVMPIVTLSSSTAVRSATPPTVTLAGKNEHRYGQDQQEPVLEVCRKAPARILAARG
jgi:hypothetical protein